MKHGPFANLFTALVMTFLVMLVSCTGQSPADLKNKITSTEDKLSESCYGIKLDGELLTKKNITKIFECGTWKDQYPSFYKAILEIPAEDLDLLLAPYNKHIFYDRTKQAKLLDIFASYAQTKDLEQLGAFLNKALGEYQLLSQLDLVLNKSKLAGIDRSLVLNVFAKDQKKNILAIQSLSHFLDLYHQDKKSWNEIFSHISKESLITRGVTVLDELAALESDQFWISSSAILSSKSDYGFKIWAQESYLKNDSHFLMTTLSENKALADESFNLISILDKGLVCPGFNIRVEKELITKMTDLADLDRSNYQRSVLDGMSKLIAFKNFCQNPDISDALDTFANITDTIMKAADVERDYKFIQTVQKTFPKGSEFKLLNFLSSDSFRAIQQTFDEIISEGHAISFSRNTFKAISLLENEENDFMSNLVFEVSKKSAAQSWYKNWAKMWKQLSVEEKTEFVNLLSIAFDSEIDSSKVLKIILSIAREFPDVTTAVSDQFDNSEFYDSLRVQVDILSQEDVRSDLSKFFSNDGLVSFLKVFTRGRETSYAPKLSRIQPAVVITGISSPLERIQSLTQSCYQKLNEDYRQGRDYYTVVNTLPSVCLDSLGEFGLVGQIYLWMNHLNHKFVSETGKEFHSGVGVWNPGMLQFIFSAAVRADVYLGRSQGQGVKAWLPQIQSDLSNSIVKERVALILDLSKNISDSTKVFDLVLGEISRKEDAAIKKDGATFFRLVDKKASKYIETNSKKVSCKDLNPSLGANPCLSKEEVKKGINDLLRIVKRKNEKNDSVIKSLLGALHPEKGILLPRKKGATEKHVITLEEIIRFSHDLNSKQTEQSFLYHNESGSTKFNGTSIERLEVIIRDISFLDNFYGAYFKNEVAHAENYRDKLESSQKLMNWLQRFSGPFRSFGVFPKETKWLLKNARASYNSLVEVSDEYPQFDGGTKNYANFIQSVLSIASSTSPEKSQDFGAFRKPDVDLVKLHNGAFITQITKLSGLRHLSSWVDSRFGEKYDLILKSKDFQAVNKNLLKKVSASDLEKAGEYLLDEYFEGKSNNLSLAINEFIDWLYAASPEEIKDFEELAAKVLILLSQEGITTSDVITFAEYLEIAIKNWKNIQSFWPSSVPFSKVISLANLVMDKALTEKTEAASLIHSMSEILGKVSKEDRDKMFGENVLISMGNLLTSFAEKDFDAQFPWASALSEMFFSKEAKLVAAKSLLSEMLRSPERELTVADYIQFLTSLEDGRTRYELLVEEFFTNQRGKLEKFLESTFQALQ